MAKYSGKIGFEEVVETEPGIWEKKIVERTYFGDLVKFYRSSTGTDKVNTDITMNNQISIVADAYANRNFFAMLYAEFLGVKWRITNIDVQPPRLILSLGGIFNVQKQGTSS